MSKQQVRLASLLLEEAFGSLVETVGAHLLKHGASNLGEIVKGTGLKTNQVLAKLQIAHTHEVLLSADKEVLGCADPTPISVIRPTHH